MSFPWTLLQTGHRSLLEIPAKRPFWELIVRQGTHNNLSIVDGSFILKFEPDTRPKTVHG